MSKFENDFRTLKHRLIIEKKKEDFDYETLRSKAGQNDAS